MEKDDFEKFYSPEKKKREMGPNEVEELGRKMEDSLEGLLARKAEIIKELRIRSGDERSAELREELEIIELQLAEDQEGLEGFIENIKSGDFRDPTITEG